MSTTTNFKRIALVAVAALGLGVLSSVPSNAAVTGVLTTTVIKNATATNSLADSTTAGTVRVRWLATANSDTVGITSSLNSQPSGGGSPTLNLYRGDTATSISPATISVGGDGIRTTASAVNDTAVVSAVAAGYAAGSFLFQLGSTPTVAGTYTYTLTFSPVTAGVVESSKVVTADVSVVVSLTAASSTTAASTYSKVTITSGTTIDSTTADASSVAVSSKATGSAVASLWVSLRNASNGAVDTKDSLTVTIDKGTVGTSTSAALGKSLVINYAPSNWPVSGIPLYIFGDGSSGAATVTIATKNAGTFTKSLSFYGSTVGSITAGSYRAVIGVGTESSKGAVYGNELDTNSIDLGSATTLYAYSSDTSIISTYGAACTWDSTDKRAYCPLTGVKAGTATITLRDADTVAGSVASSPAISVRVSQGVASAFKLTTDKATYAPGEKGYLLVTVLDAAGNTMPALSNATVLAIGGISVNAQLGNSSDTLTATQFSTDRSSTPASTEAVKVYTFYAPVSGGAFTFSAKGATGYSAASVGTATTVTASVTDNASAALAAVTALATTVASLKTLITTLTNLVLKIQKKVKA